MDSANETREDVLHVPNLFDYFCTRTAADMMSRGSAANEAPTVSFASIIVTILAAFAFWVFGKPALAKATFVLFGVLLAWTVWGVIIRSSEQTSRKASNVKAGVFPAAAAPFVLARLKWWNHLIVPQRWGRHSRLFDRRTKLERKIGETEAKFNELVAAGQNIAAYPPPAEQEVVTLAESLQSFSQRNAYETQVAALEDETARVRAELVLYHALMYKLAEMSDKLERIEKLVVVFHNVSPDDLSQVTGEAIQLLEERRLLVLSVDQIDPDDFIDLVTIRTA